MCFSKYNKEAIANSQTVDGELIKRIREADKKLSEITGDQCKIVERSGTKLLQILHKSNPWQNVKCGRESR